MPANDDFFFSKSETIPPCKIEISGKSIEFFVDCEPPITTYQSTRKIAFVKGRTIVVDDYRAKKLRKFYKSILSPFAPKETFKIPVKLTIEYRFPCKKGLTKKAIAQIKENEAEGLLLLRQRRPDADNLAKMLVDALVENGFLEDDNIVCKLFVAKYYVSERTGIYIHIQTIGGDDEKQTLFNNHEQ